MPLFFQTISTTNARKTVAVIATRLHIEMQGYITPLNGDLCANGGIDCVS